MTDASPGDDVTTAASPDKPSGLVRVVLFAVVSIPLISAAAGMAFVVFANNGLADMKALHSKLTPGMRYRDVMAVAEGVPRARWSCVGDTKPTVPPCETLFVYTNGDQGSQWGTRVAFTVDGAVVRVGPIEYVD